MQNCAPAIGGQAGTGTNCFAAARLAAMEAAKPRKVFTRRLERFTVRWLHPSRRPPAAGSLGWGCVPRMLRSAISAFTRVFDALWRCAADPGSIVLPHRPVSRLCGASSGRCFASPGERCTASGTRDLLLHTPSSETLVARSAATPRVLNHVAVGCAAIMTRPTGKCSGIRV
jgi:hypothetical protein